MGAIPAGIITHMSNAAPTPRSIRNRGWSPPGKEEAKSKPEKATEEHAMRSELVSRALRRARPTAPRPSPRRGSIQTQAATPGSTCTLIEILMLP